MLKVITSWEFWVMVGLFVITILLMSSDPLKLNPDGLDGESIWVLIYTIPAIVIWYLIFKKSVK